jgi:hypothetical protein
MVTRPALGPLPGTDGYRFDVRIRLALLGFCIAAGCGSSIPSGQALTDLCDALRRAESMSSALTSGAPGSGQSTTMLLPDVASRSEAAAAAYRHAESLAPGSLDSSLRRRAEAYDRVATAARESATEQEFTNAVLDEAVILTGASVFETDQDALRHFQQDHCGSP